LTDSTGIFNRSLAYPAQRLATRRPAPCFFCIRKGSFDTARATSRRAEPFSYCTVVEIATHPILRATRADRVNPIHSHPTRVCVSCVTNTGLPKSTNLCSNAAGKADRNTDCSWSGQGARPSNTAPPRGQWGRSIALRTRRASEGRLPIQAVTSEEPSLARRVGRRVVLTLRGSRRAYDLFRNCGMVPMWPY
jgi:hypothetical protein